MTSLSIPVRVSAIVASAWNVLVLLLLLLLLLTDVSHWLCLAGIAETELTDSAYSRIYGRLPIPRSYVPLTTPSRAAFYGEWD